MKCEWAMLCEDIEPHPNGGFSIIGVFATVSVDRLPGTLPLSMAVRVSGAQGETGECLVVIRDPEGQVLKSVPPEVFTIGPYGTIDFTAPLGPLSLKKEGSHSVIVSIDDTEVWRLSMPVTIIRLM